MGISVNGVKRVEWLSQLYQDERLEVRLTL
jgi:hypothetical protein